MSISVRKSVSVCLTGLIICADGLLVFYEIFCYLENIMILPFAELHRTEAFETDLDHYLNKEWRKNYSPRESVVKNRIHLREVEDKDLTLLMAYMYQLYIHGFLHRYYFAQNPTAYAENSPFKGSNSSNNNTDFEEISIYELESDLHESMKRVAESLDKDKKNKLIEESKLVCKLIKSVQTSGNVLERSNSDKYITDFEESSIYELKRDLHESMKKVAESLDEDMKNKLITESKIVSINIKSMQTSSNVLERSNSGNNITDFKEIGKYILKSNLHESMKRVAEFLDEDMKNKLIEESKIVCKIIKSVQTSGNVLERSNSGNNITDFEESRIYELKRDLHESMKKVAESLDEHMKNKLIEK